MVSTQKGTQRRRARGEGAVYFDSTRGKWVGQVWIDGHRRKVSAATKEGAAKALGKLIHGDPAERHVDRQLTVAALLDEWLEKALPNRGRAPSTVERHKWAVSRLKAELGKSKVAVLDAARVERALSSMAKDGLSRASLTEVRGTLSQALAWAVRRRVATHNAAAAAELPTNATAAKKKNALTVDELTLLLAALEGHRWRAMYALMARVGLRPGEAAGVCTDAIDLDAEPPTVAVVRAVHLERGSPVLGNSLKTAGARRTLAIPRDVAAMLQVGSDSPPEGLLFTAPRGGPVWPSTVRSELAAACTAAKIPKVTPNELRHSAATHMSERLAPHQIADVLGHTTSRMVDETYRHRPAVIRGAEA